MQIQGFSCTRPQPEHMDQMRACATAAELDGLVAAGAYTTDVSRALYLVARRHDDVVTTGVACCCSAAELDVAAVDADEATARADEIEAHASHHDRLRGQPGARPHPGGCALGHAAVQPLERKRAGRGLAHEQA